MKTNTLGPQDILGQRISEVVISKPDRPVSMTDMSTSVGYLRLENGIIIDIGATNPPLPKVTDIPFPDAGRDKEYEKEFQALVGQRIADVRVTTELGLVCIFTENSLVVTEVPAQFWVRPCLYSKGTLDVETERLWESTPNQAL